MILPYVTRYRVRFFELVDEALANSGIEFRVYSGKPVGRDALRRDEHAFASIRLRQLRLPLGNRTLLLRVIPRSVMTADLIVLEQATRNLESYPIAAVRNLLRRPVAQWGHGHTITEPQGRTARFLQRWLMRRSSWFFAYTARSAERGQRLGADPRRTSVLNNTFDFDELQRMKDDPTVLTTSRVAGLLPSRDRWAALYVGGLDRDKQVDFLLEAGQRLHEHDPRFALIVAGRGELEDQVNSLAYSDWLFYIGTASDADKAAAAQRAKVMLVPGRVGLVAIDSFALGIPIITTDFAFHAPEYEYLSPTNSITTASDIDDYVQGVLSAMNDRPRLAALSRSAASAAEHYRIEHMADAFVDGILQSLQQQDRIQP